MRPRTSTDRTKMETRHRRKTKYDPLGEYLSSSGQEELALTFDQIEEILGFDMPPSAYKYDMWWSNGQTSHPQARAWGDYGYEVSRVRRVERKVIFHKKGTPMRHKRESVAPEKTVDAADSRMIYGNNADTITVCGYDFTFIQELQPERDADGKVVEYAPQSGYGNPHGKPLHNYGSGTFCHFSIKAGNWPGVYLWVVDDEIIYIGETVKLGQRFNAGYGIISGINCYAGGQMTNCKMNKVVLELAKIGKTVKLYFFNTRDYKRVELELLGEINTRYNVKDNT